MKAINKSILVLTLMIIFGPVSDSYAEALSSQEILAVCDDGFCDDQTLEVKAKKGDYVSEYGDTKEEAIGNAQKECKDRAIKRAHNALKAQADNAKKTGELAECNSDEGCEHFGIHVPLLEDVEITKSRYYTEYLKQSDDGSKWYAEVQCTITAKMTITRICTSKSNQCIKQEKEFAQVQKLLEQK